MPVDTVKTNTFYIAANIIFDLATGETKNVLMLVNKVEDASVFNSKDAQTYLIFVTHRSKGIVWEIEAVPSAIPQQVPIFLRKAAGLPTADRFIIKGVQYV